MSCLSTAKRKVNFTFTFVFHNLCQNQSKTFSQFPKHHYQRSGLPNTPCISVSPVQTRWSPWPRTAISRRHPPSMAAWNALEMLVCWYEGWPHRATAYTASKSTLMTSRCGATRRWRSWVSTAGVTRAFLSNTKHHVQDWKSWNTFGDNNSQSYRL